jgi:hypothetical protein
MKKEIGAISIETGRILRNCLDNFNFKHTALHIIVFLQKNVALLTIDIDIL